MSDSKTIYRTTVWEQKKNSFFNSELAKSIKGGMGRAAAFKQNWQSINLNIFVEKFAPNPIISLQNGRIYFTSQDGKMAVIADIGGTLILQGA